MTQKRMAFESLDGHNITEEADSFSECVTSTGGPYVCAGRYEELRRAAELVVREYDDIESRIDFDKYCGSLDVSIMYLRSLIE